MSTLPFIDQQRINHPVQQLCQVLGVVPSRYYAWRLAQGSEAVDPPEPAWETEMVAIFDDHKRRYGTRRLQVELREKGHWVGRQALRTGLRRHHRRALQPKAFVPRTTDSTHGQRCAPNLLLDQPRPTQANRVWVSGPHVFAPGQWPLGVPVRLSGRVHQARGGLAGAGRYARSSGHQRLVASAAGPSACPLASLSTTTGVVPR